MKKKRPEPVRVLTFTQNFEYKLWKIYREKIKNIKDFVTPNTKINDLENYTENELNKATDETKPIIHESIRSAYVIGQNYANKNLKKLSIDPFSNEDINRIEDVEGITNISIKGVSDRLKTKIIQKVRLGVSQGKSIQNIMKEIMPDLSDRTRFEIMRIARTETMRAVSSGTLQRYSEEKIQKVEWIDGQVGACPECATNDGRVFTIEEAEGLIPLHPMCRCCWAPKTL